CPSCGREITTIRHFAFFLSNPKKLKPRFADFGPPLNYCKECGFKMVTGLSEWMELSFTRQSLITSQYLLNSFFMSLVLDFISFILTVVVFGLLDNGFNSSILMAIPVVFGGYGFIAVWLSLRRDIKESNYLL